MIAGVVRRRRNPSWVSLQKQMSEPSGTESNHALADM